MPDPILILAGPTAVGKTETSLRLAEMLGAEIISADSRQVYRELTIGTAKPAPNELVRVRHHFVDELTLDQPFSAGIFARAAYERIDDIISRGRVPLVTGGSTLYIHALEHGLSEIPDVPDRIRKELGRRLRHEGPAALHEELRRVDPVSATAIDPTKTQRLIRALEVYHGTGRALSSYHASRTPPPSAFRTVVLHRDRKELYARIEQRVDMMLEAGLLDEVREVLVRGFDPSLNALRTIGYQEPIAHLAGRIDFDEMVRLLKRNTRRYAKRQLTWFRRFPEYEWVHADEFPMP